MREFLLRALECRLEKVNDGASEGESVELEHLIELHLAEGLTLADSPISSAGYPVSAKRCRNGRANRLKKPTLQNCALQCD